MRSGRPDGARGRRLALLGLCAAALAAVAAREVESIPRGVVFAPSDDANLAFNGKVGERCARSFTIRNETGNEIRLFSFRLNDADWEKISDKRGVVLPPGGEHIVTVVYKPAQAGRTSNPRLVFNVRLARNRIEQAAVRFSGVEGDACAPPEPEEEEEEGGGGGVDPDEPPGGVDPGTGFTDFGPVPQDERQHTICVRVHIVTEGWPDADGGRGERPTRERLEQCIKAANGWYSGVDFELRPPEGPPGEVASPENESTDDPHCINIYIVHGQWFDQHPEKGDTPEETRSKAGHTEMQPPPRNPKWKNDAGEPSVTGDLAAAGADGTYLDGLAAGTRITVEAGDHLCSTIGHELGHALGLGLGPGKTHTQPDDGAEIGDGDRLTHKNGNGSKLSDLEQAVAKRVAQYMDEVLLIKCFGGSRIIDGPGIAPPPPRNELRQAGISNQGEVLRIHVRTASAFDPREVAPTLTLEFDGDDDGAADLALNYAFAGGEWQVESVPALPDTIPLPAPGFLLPTHTAGPASTRGIVVELPEEALPGEASVIGWRVTLALPALDSRATLPPSGFDRLDTTDPAFALILDPAGAPLRAAPDGRLAVRGSAHASSTFGGDVALAAVLTSATDTLRLVLDTLRSPLPAAWTAEVLLPDSLPVGRYALTLYGTCDECRLATGFVGELLVGAGSVRGGPARYLPALLLGLGLLVWLLLRRRRSRATLND
jgi:hypothetical protein